MIAPDWNTSEPERVPSNPEAEQAVLGTILLDRSVVGRVASIVRPNDFYLPAHRAIYVAMLAVWDRSEAVDYLTVVSELENTHRLTEAGGATTLADLIGTVPTPVHAEAYAQLVADSAVCRRLISAGSKIAELGFTRAPNGLERAEQLLDTVNPERMRLSAVTMADAMSALIDEMRAPADASAVIPTGLTELDRILKGGLHRDTLTILGGRPGQGKSGLALTIALDAAIRAHASVYVCSLEMSVGELSERALAGRSGIPSHRFRGALNDRESARIGYALGDLAEADIRIDASPSVSHQDIRSRIRAANRAAPLDLVIVDHLQLVAAPGVQGGRVHELSAITASLKRLAREEHVAVLALSQLSRAVEQRTPPIPRLSDLRDSGALEADADVVALLYRPSYYEPTIANDGIADLHVVKHRNGETGQVSLYFDAATTRFGSLDLGSR